MPFQLVKRFGAVPLYVWILALVIAPNLLLILTSFLMASGGVTVYEFSLDNYERALGSDTVRLLIAKTLLTALSAAFLATLIAYPLAFFVSRHLGRYKLLAVLLVIVPLWVSVMIRAFAWRIILGESGILNTFLVTSGLIAEPSDAFLFTRFSVLLALTYMAIPFVFVTSYTALERVPNSLIESAYDNGASPFRTLLHVIWPLTRQGAAIGFCLAFLIAVGDYLTPTMVGGLDGTMVGMVIASQFGLAGNWPYGSAMAIVLMIAVLLILVTVAFFTRTKGVIDAVDSGAGALSVRKAKGVKRLLRPAGLAIGVGGPLAFLYLPLLIIGIFSFNDAQIQSMPLSSFTTKWYAELWNDSDLINAFWRTIEVGVTTVCVSIIVAVAFALVLAYLRIRGGGILQGLIALPVAIPGVVLGISVVIAAQQVGIEAGVTRVVIGHSLFVMPVILLIVLGRLNRLDKSFGHAAMDLGANYLKTFYYVLFPLIKSAIFGGALLGFTLSMDEVIVTLFLAGSEPTLPVYVWNQMRFGFTPSVNAVFTLIGVGSLCLVLCGVWILSRGQKSKSGTPEWLIQ